MCIKQLHTVLEKNFVLYQKAHSYHWNVEGLDFVVMHGFFGDVYTDAFGQLDMIAEHIRAAGEFVKFAGVKVDIATTHSSLGMAMDLSKANDELIASLKVAFAATDDEGIKNYLADRLDNHAKLKWKFTAMGASTKLKESEITVINGINVIMEDGKYIGIEHEGEERRLEEAVSTFTALIEKLNATA